MRRSVIGLVLALIVLIANGAVFAAGLDSWRNLGGFIVDGQKTPAELSMTKEGLKVTIPKGHYDDDGNYSGVIFMTPVDTEKLTVEFTIDKVAGYGNDTWIGLHVLNKPEYFSVSNPEQSQGLVTLIRSISEEEVQFQVLEHVDSFSWKIGLNMGHAPEASYIFELIKTDESYIYSIDGSEVITLYGLNDVFAGNKGYFSMGASTDNGEPTVFTITKINGKPVSQL